MNPRTPASYADAALLGSGSGSESRFLFTLGGRPADVVEFHAKEELSAPFQVDVTIAIDIELGFDDVRSVEAVLSIKGHSNEPNRHFHGIVRKIHHLGSDGRFYCYKIQMVPALWLLSIGSKCRIFQQTTLEQIITSILAEYDIVGDCIDFRLEREKIQRKFAVQYRESDLQFISRLLEEEGIFYFFEHSNDTHVVVFSDTTAYYREIAGSAKVTFNTNHGMAAEHESVFGLYRSDRIRPGRFTHGNYNFKTPTLDLTTDHDPPDDESWEVYEFPGAYAEDSRGKQLAKIRFQEMQALKEKVRGQSSCPRLVPGATFTLSDHPLKVLNAGYLLVEVNHEGRQPQALEEMAGDGSSSYCNTFLAIPDAVTYRPDRLTSKPAIPGIQSARVTGPPGEEIYTDRYGRVKVQFPWDREGDQDERSSCWLRVAQFWNGAVQGSQFIPRVGDEVLVAFVNGDMDYPVIIGSGINENLMPNYTLPQKRSQSGLRTRSYPNGGFDNYHELRFEDLKGSEEIYLQSERDWNILVKNDKGQRVVHDEVLRIGNNRTKTIGADQVVQIGQNHTEMIGANKSVSVGLNKNVTVAMNSAESVGLAKELTVGGAYQVSVAGAMNESVIGAKAEEVGFTKQLLVASDMNEQVAGTRSLTVGEDLSATVKKSTTIRSKNIIFDAEEEIILRSGAATISLKSNGQIIVEGADLIQRASGEIIIKGARTTVN